MKDSFTGKYIKKHKSSERDLVRNVINLYNNKIAERILKGEQYELLGKIYLTKVIIKSPKPICLSGATARARKETGDSSVTIYRTNSYWFKLIWSGRFTYDKLEVIFVREHTRNIPKHEEELLIHAPIYNK